jgi:hypothetical protein
MDTWSACTTLATDVLDGHSTTDNMAEYIPVRNT